MKVPKISDLLPVLAFGLILLSCSSNKSTNPNTNVTDTIESVTIGTQVWMVKNLTVDHYRNGDSIPEITDQNQWGPTKSGAWCYNFNSDTVGAIYGRLYNWYAVADSRSIAPVGWHVPSDSEWTILIDYLGGTNVAGGKLKESTSAHWNSPNTGATNETGFTSRPGGFHNFDGKFGDIGKDGHWWSSTAYNSGSAWNRKMYYTDAAVGRQHLDGKMVGFSVRCIKD